MTNSTERPDRERSERLQTLAQLDEWIEKPMIALGLVWLGLIVLELTRGLNPMLEAVSVAIWVLFILEFALRLALAPDRGRYVTSNWIGAVSLLVPALRVFRIARALRVLRIARATRGLRLVRVVASVNRGMTALRRGMSRRGLGYVLALTVIVTLAGAAGIHAFERDASIPARFGDFASSLWWTAMMMTTLGADFWPASPEGRVLCLMLAIYAFAVWGYITASLATFFLGRDAERADSELAGRTALEQLRADIAVLRSELAESGRNAAATQ